MRTKDAFGTGMRTQLLSAPTQLYSGRRICFAVSEMGRISRIDSGTPGEAHQTNTTVPKCSLSDSAHSTLQRSARIRFAVSEMGWLL